ncbi:MAG: purine-binding chemotaxis protein CheW [Nitrospira sp.]|nr:purine-binding chemotaxis protein CheW [Nitrospira sp.]
MQLPCELPRLTSDGESEHATPTGSWKACLVTLGGELFAIDLRQVLEVFELDTITPVPGMPPSLVGVANVRGTVVPLADLRRSLGVSPSTTSRYAVVVRHDAHQIGLLIDEVPEIRWMLPEDLLEHSGTSRTGEPSLLSGLIRVENRVSRMLEIPALVASVEAATTDVSQSVNP